MSGAVAVVVVAMVAIVVVVAVADTILYLRLLQLPLLQMWPARNNLLLEFLKNIALAPLNVPACK